ncbi:MAG: formate dehydrogenase accessory sulfurtransferase FdhD [Pseudomonadota bacterium]
MSEKKIKEMRVSYPYHVCEYSNSSFQKTLIHAIQEVPLLIHLNDQHIKTLLCTGKHPKALAIGFLKSEGFLSEQVMPNKIYIKRETDSIYVYIHTTINPLSKPSAPRPISSLLSTLPMKKGLTVSAEQIIALMDMLDKRSRLYRKTGGCHNASLALADRLLLFYEDLGRHNAIDMIHGACFLEKTDTSDKLIVTTGRISSEILIKAARIGVPILASLSAATSLAIDLAVKIKITLIGYVRGESMVIYNHANRIIGI